MNFSPFKLPPSFLAEDYVSDFAEKFNRRMYETAFAARLKSGELTTDESFAVAFCAGARVNIVPSEDDPCKLVMQTESVGIARDSDG